VLPTMGAASNSLSTTRLASRGAHQAVWSRPGRGYCAGQCHGHGADLPVCHREGSVGLWQAQATMGDTCRAYG
jgi:hypothetical protein